MDTVKKLKDHEGAVEGKHYKKTLFRSERLLLGVNCLEPGQVQSPHRHEGQDKFYYVTEGAGRFQIGDQTMSVSAGEIVWAAAGVLHGVVNDGDCRLTMLVGIAPAP